MLRGRLWRPGGVRSSKGGGSYRSPLPEAKEGKAPSQTPRNINPINTQARDSVKSVKAEYQLAVTKESLLRVILEMDAYKATHMVKSMGGFGGAVRPSSGPGLDFDGASQAQPWQLVKIESRIPAFSSRRWSCLFNSTLRRRRKSCQLQQRHTRWSLRPETQCTQGSPQRSFPACCEL